MRRFWGLAAVVLAAACGSSGGGVDGPSTPTTGTVQFRLDANTCSSIFGSQTLNFTFFIDGATAGSANLGINITSPGYTVAAGTHVAGATVTNSTLHWQNLSATVAAGGSFTYILSCS